MQLIFAIFGFTMALSYLCARDISTPELRHVRWSLYMICFSSATGLAILFYLLGA